LPPLKPKLLSTNFAFSNALRWNEITLPINGTQRVAPQNDTDISSQFEKGLRIALVEPTFTAAAEKIKNKSNE
jgi:hypothetical protein